jgi:selenocysteine-specific elongation factor
LAADNYKKTLKSDKITEKYMTEKQIIIGTAGHVDHGKTTLIKALTGIDADRWQEEKERGITIDIGFAHLDTQSLSLSFIDVPGHKDFVTNMLSGIFSIDMAILIVAADESVMPQTREHLSILSFLGVENIIPVITKTDLADSDMVELTTLEVEELFDDLNLTQPKKMFFVSSKTNRGVEELKNHLICEGEKVIHNNLRPFYLPVDRSFTIKGHGTVVTGTLMSGEVSVDDKVFVYPLKREAYVKNITSHNNKVTTAKCKKRVALNLPSLKKEQVKRGQIIVKKESDISTSIADAFVKINDSTAQFEDLKRVRISIGTDDVIARVKLIEQKEYKTPFEGYCQLRFEHSVPCFNGQKFIVRSYSPVTTIGGGEVVLSQTVKHKGFREAPQYLSLLRAKSLKDKITGIVLAKKVLHRNSIANILFYKQQLIEKELSDLIKENKVILIEDTVYESNYFFSLCSQTIQLVLEYQKKNKMKQGMPISEIPSNLTASLNYLLENNKLIKLNAVIKTPDFKQSLTVQQKDRYNKLVKQIENGKFSPPLTSAFEKEFGKEAADFVALAVSEEKIVRISRELYFSKQVFNDFIEKFKLLAKEKSVFEVKDFKDAFAVSRKYIIPMLEFLDGERLITREGDFRKVLKENLENYGKKDE